MKIITVIAMEHEEIITARSFTENDRKKAEQVFEKMILASDPDIVAEDLEEAIEDGTYVEDSHFAIKMLETTVDTQSH